MFSVHSSPARGPARFDSQRPGGPAGQLLARRASSLRFLLTALLWMILLYGAYYFPYARGTFPFEAIERYLRLLAFAAAGLIGLFDPTATAHDTLIGGRFPLQIVKSCSALDAQALYAAAALAFPARPWLKAVGLLIGVLTLTLLNLARIGGLYFVGVHAPAAFDAIHEEVLPLVLVGASCLIFALWARWVSRGLQQRAA